MGYCVELTNHNFKINRGDGEKVLNGLKEYIKTHERPMWVTPKEVLSSEDIFKAFDSIRYELINDENGDYVLNDFHGEKFGDDTKILNSIAKYIVKNSFIEFTGEDNSVITFKFDGKNCKEVWE